jgi:hypothetical protein
MKVTFSIPASLNDVRLQQYQKYMDILKQNEDVEGGEQFITAKLVSTMCDVDYSTLQKMELTQYEIVVNQLSEVLKEQPKFQKFIELDGIKFGFIPKIDEISFGEYIDLEQYIKDPKDYHKAMGVLYRPVITTVKETYLIEEYRADEMYAEAMRQVSLNDTLAALLFFWNLGRELVNCMSRYLQKAKIQTMMDSETSTSSTQNGDGIPALMLSHLETYLNSIPLPVCHYTNASLN